MNTGMNMTAARRIVVLMVLTGAIVALTTGSALADSSGFGPSPGPLQSRCAALVVSSHLGFDGKELTAHAGPGMPDACGGGKLSWSWSVSSPVHGCTTNATTCTFRVGASTDDTWQQVCINGSSTQGGWESCDYYGVPAAGKGVIEGYVKDKDGGPVVGADVSAYGEGYGRRGASAPTGADGFYAIQVKAGTYSVIPSGGPHGKTEPRYEPSVVHPSVARDSETTADFQLKAGIELKLTLAKDRVAADGFEVVSGTIATTEYGKPAPNIQVQLDALPGVRSDVIGTTTPRAAICAGGGRVWPNGTVSDPSYSPVNVTTDADGHYDFSVTVGTTPGTWKLDAWAYNTDGTLSADTTAASETRSISFTPVGSGDLADFASQLNTAVHSSSALQMTSGQASDLTPTLAQITATYGVSGTLGGYAYALVNAADGQSLLVFPSGHAPVLARSGDVNSGGDLVIDPAEWTGSNVHPLATTIQSSQFPGAPTVTQFDTGVSTPGWTAASHNELTPVTGSFEYLGWAYPSSTVGACY